MIDYDQQEFRMFLDYAGEKEIIRRVMDGEDVHTSSATLLNISRSQDKTINFGLIYGLGIERLAEALGVSPKEATTLKSQYFRNLPGVRRLMRQVVTAAKARGFIKNWFGREYRLTNYDLAYTMINKLIQGGCADVCKIAMNQCDDYFMAHDLRSRLLVQIHDELLFEIHESELHICKDLKKIMEDVYPSFNGLKLTCSIEHSWKSWAHKDKTKGEPCLKLDTTRTAPLLSLSPKTLIHST
jgi:DNA polymerase-1